MKQQLNNDSQALVSPLCTQDTDDTLACIICLDNIYLPQCCCICIFNVFSELWFLTAYCHITLNYIAYHSSFLAAEEVSQPRILKL